MNFVNVLQVEGQNPRTSSFNEQVINARVLDSNSIFPKQDDGSFAIGRYNPTGVFSCNVGLSLYFDYSTNVFSPQCQEAGFTPCGRNARIFPVRDHRCGLVPNAVLVLVDLFMGNYVSGFNKDKK